MLQDE